MSNAIELDEVTIKDTPATKVAFMEHKGTPASIGSTIQQFIAWRKANRLPPKTNKTFNIFHSDPRNSEIADFHIDLCVETNMEISGDEDKISSGMIPGGRCAFLRVVGNPDNLEDAAQFLYQTWLPQSGEEARDFPIYCERISFFPEVAENEAVSDLYLPLK